MHLIQEKSKLLARIRRLKGQLDAVERAVEAERDCGEILQLVASIRGATAGLTAELIEEHVEHHVVAPEGNDARRQGADQLMAAIRTYLR